MRRVLSFALCTVASLLWFAALSHSPVLAGRVRKDLPSSENGSSGTAAATCIDSATPYAAVLNGKVTVDNSCSIFAGQTYPNYVQTLAPSDHSFTLTVTPILWENGASSLASRQTILHLEFSSTNPNLALQSFVIGGLTEANGNLTPAYVTCDLDQTGSFPYVLPAVSDNQPGDTIAACTQPTMSPQGVTPDEQGHTSVIQATPIQFADTNTTRWDIVGLAGSNPLASPLPSVDIVVAGFPNDLSPDVDPNNPPSTPPPTNNLTQSFMADPSNFLAVAFDSGTGSSVSAGTLSIPTVTASLSNDSIAAAKVVDSDAATGAGFTDQINTASAEPHEASDGTVVNAPTSPADPILPATCFDGGTTDAALFRTVWYSFTPPTDGTVTIDTANSRYDTVLAVFTGAPGSLALLGGGCSDDFTDNNNDVHRQAKLTDVPVTHNTQYFILVGESPTQAPPPVNLLNDPSTDQAASPAVTVAAPLSNDATLFLSVKAALASAPDFTLSATQLSPSSVTAGGSATSSITVAPLNGFAGDVILTCSVTGGGTPAPTCSFNPATVPNGTGTSTLTVNTTAPKAADLLPKGGKIFAFLLLPFGGLVVLELGAITPRKRWFGAFLSLLILTCLVCLPGCGGGSSSGSTGGQGQPGTPHGTYTITISGTSGSLTHMTSVSLTL